MELQRTLPDTVEFDQAISKSPARLWDVIAFLERFIAAIGLLLISPLLLTAGIIIALLSRRSPLVSHRRVGHEGNPLWVLKLRTMWECSSPGAAQWAWIEKITAEPVSEIKLVRDPRVTSRFAAFCRKYSIDELPQLWQVVTGEMALVGPRPLTKGEIAQYYGEFAERLLMIKPGLTGLWQVKGRSRLTYRQRCKFDLFMIDHWSLRLYLKILAATVPGVLFGKDAR